MQRERERREEEGPNLLMHTEEVDLDHWDDAAMDGDVGWDGGDETDELVVAGGADTNMPIRQIAWGLQGPPKELFGIIESKSTDQRGGAGTGGESQRGQTERERPDLNMLSSSST
jgi:hypothetical protein